MADYASIATVRARVKMQCFETLLYTFDLEFIDISFR